MPRAYVPSCTIGIDLASQPKRTAACVIDWTASPPQVRWSEKDLTDQVLLELMLHPHVSRVGIDAPFGWPQPFVTALTQHDSTGTWPLEPDDYEAQRELVLRSTDRVVRDGLGPQPLSVSTDRISFAAMRCARLLSALAAAGHPVDRAGSGKVIEVYPAAALRCWGISPSKEPTDPGGYKGKGVSASARRSALVSRLVDQARGSLDISTDLRDQCREDDDKLDALLCALVARAADTNRVQPAPTEAGVARTEGWIVLPNQAPLSTTIA